MTFPFSTDRGGKPDGALEREAAAWAARRDRGLSSEEQDRFLQWLSGDPRRAEAVSRQEAGLKRLLAWSQGRFDEAGDPDPDLFARRSRSAAWRWAAAAAVAAVITVGFLGVAVRYSPGLFQRRGSAILLVHEFRTLEDGSTVDLNEGAKVSVRYSPGVRHVVLARGEAHFHVARNLLRPFVVEAAGVAIRAVGTAFDVRIEPGAVDVLVTEGTVRVGGAAPERPATVTAGEQAVVPQRDAARGARVTRLTREEIDEALSWEVPRFRFLDTPLAAAVAAFNRRNGRRIVLGDPRLASVPIGGTFRVDNVDAFVRLLELTVGVRARALPNGDTLLVAAR